MKSHAERLKWFNEARLGIYGIMDCILFWNAANGQCIQNALHLQITPRLPISSIPVPVQRQNGVVLPDRRVPNI